MKGRRRTPIYVESLIDAPMDALWKATQEPDQHQRWDVRFGEIAYQSKVAGEPQRFTYATRPGLTQVHGVPEIETLVFWPPVEVAVHGEQLDDSFTPLG